MNDRAYSLQTIEEMPACLVVAGAHFAHLLVMPARATHREDEDTCINCVD